MNAYDYHQPSSVDEAIALAIADPESQFIAGGTDLMVQLRQRREISPSSLISLRSVRELQTIEDGPRLRIGGGVPLTEIARHPAVREKLPALIESFRVFASRQIRNVATLGGNLGNASPAADTAPPLLVYEASVELHGSAGRREVRLVDFFRGPGVTDLARGELITAILVDTPSARSRSIYLRKGRVDMDIALASVATFLEMDGETCRCARVAAGSVAPVPLRLTRTEAVLVGTRLDDDTVTRAVEAARSEVSPIDDLRSTADYRRVLVGVFLRRAIAAGRERS